VADLQVESASLQRASGLLGHAPDPIQKPETAFKVTRGDLNAFGALGSMMHAQAQVGKAMDDLAAASAALRTEWGSESDILSTLAQAFADLDSALAGGTPTVHTPHGRALAE
jgi:hypothetical protein